MIAGRDAPTHGEAKNSWLTGTAAWNYVAITQWILGIRPGYDGLQIAPVLPADLAGLHRHARLSRRHLPHHRRAPGRPGQPASALAVDGQPVAGNTVPLPAPGQTEVAVWATLS